MFFSFQTIMITNSDLFDIVEYEMNIFKKIWITWFALCCILLSTVNNLADCAISAVQHECATTQLSNHTPTLSSEPNDISDTHVHDLFCSCGCHMIVLQNARLFCIYNAINTHTELLPNVDQYYINPIFVPPKLHS